LSTTKCVASLGELRELGDEHLADRVLHAGDGGFEDRERVVELARLLDRLVVEHEAERIRPRRELADPTLPPLSSGIRSAPLLPNSSWRSRSCPARPAPLEGVRELEQREVGGGRGLAAASSARR
jgi:hypothetical protein